ncbi:hypothetical protein, partial [Mycoplasmopsis gallinarum]|uniref:hypothetical protein n=1 Tax=Mycoplasmopsis gallinarum TaxID=29557 RepID=UPI00129064B3
MKQIQEKDEMKLKIINFVKNPSSIEFFYDIAFGFAIGKFTNVFFILNNSNTLSLYDFVKFLTVVLFFLNAWFYKTIFINKFGEYGFKLVEVIFSLFEMFLVILWASLINNYGVLLLVSLSIFYAVFSILIIIQNWIVFLNNYPSISKWKKSILFNLLSFLIYSSLIFLSFQV